MPVYLFQCQCGVRFEAVAPIKEYLKPKPCPSCAQMADRHVPEDVSGVFNQQVTGPAPQNTGLSQLDAHIDRVIGQHAKQGWESIDQREQDKRQLAQVRPGLTQKDVVRTPDGGYDVANPQSRGFYDRAHVINGIQEKVRQGNRKP